MILRGAAGRVRPQHGGGVGQGVVYGSSDRIAAHPTAHPHDPKDLAATVYHLLGVPENTVIYDQTARPNHLVVGRKIDGLLVGIRGEMAGKNVSWLTPATENYKKVVAMSRAFPEGSPQSIAATR